MFNSISLKKLDFGKIIHFMVFFCQKINNPNPNQKSTIFDPKKIPNLSR